MKAHTFRSYPNLLPLAALLLASGLAQAIEPPRVMFVSGLETMPVIIDLQGKEIPAKKGQVIPPGYSVKVPAGATVQIMTDEKAIVAVRQNSLLKLEKLGDGKEPHKFKLDLGGLRVANSEKKPHKFEVDTPNAKITFDKGDHEAFYLKEGNKVTGDRWGTFVRGFKEDSVLSTKDGDTTVDRTKVGYVAGTSKAGKIELIDRIKVGGSFSDPVSNLYTGSRGQVGTDLVINQKMLSDERKTFSPDPSGTVPLAPTTFNTPKTLDPTPIILTKGVLPTAGIDPAMGRLALQEAKPPVVQLPKDLYIDPVSKVAILVDGDKLSLLGNTPSAAKGQTISIKEFTKVDAPVTPPPPPPAGTPTSKAVTTSTINNVLSTRIIQRVK